MKTLIAVVLSMTSFSVFAGAVIYTCNTDKGKVYQDHPCEKTAQTANVAAMYIPEVCGSSCGTPTGNSYADRSGGQSSAPVTDTVVQSSGGSQDSTRSSNVHECSGGGKTWIQSTPCPAEVTHKTHYTAPVMGTDQYGNPISGTMFGTQTEHANVQQTNLSHDQACQQLDARKLTGKPSDVYERNKMRNDEGC